VSDVNGREVAPDGHQDFSDQALEFKAAPGDANIVEIPVHNGPISGIAVSPDGRRVMVTHLGNDSVSVIHTGSHRVVQTFEGIAEPYAIAVDKRDAARAYVSTALPAFDSIVAIDLTTDTVVATYPLALSVSDLAVSADGRYVYASRNGAGAADVAVVDTETEKVEVIDVGDAPGATTHCVRVSSDGSRLYVGTNGPAASRLVVIGTRADDGTTRARSRRHRKSTRSPENGLRVIDSVEIGLPIRDIALNPDGTTAYVASCGPDTGAVLDVVDTRTNKITGTRKIAEIGGLLTGLTISGDGDRAYLVSDEGITVLCTLTHDVIGTITVDAQPSCLVESPDGKRLYVAGYDGTVTVAPAASTAASIEGAGQESEWAMPELLQYEAALV
jgi:YVTN family beta-propeller protein